MKEMGDLNRAIVEAHGDPTGGLLQQREAKERELASIWKDIEDLREAMNRRRG